MDPKTGTVDVYARTYWHTQHPLHRNSIDILFIPVIIDSTTDINFACEILLLNINYAYDTLLITSTGLQQ